jgi:glycosyltransferase involved in cell wall biosynthesis
MKKIAVITASTGRKELQKAIDSVASQTHPCTHYIFFDGIACPPSIQLHQKVHSIELPVKTGLNGIMNGAICAASAYLIEEEYICWLDDDNWFEENHIEFLFKAIENKEYAYSLRKLINHDGSFWDNDNFESIGHHGNFIDLNCYLMKKTLATKIAPLWFNTTGELMIGDRFIFNALKENNISWGASGKYTVNYRLNPNRDLKSFFENGNMKNKLLHPNGFPWQFK